MPVVIKRCTNSISITFDGTWSSDDATAAREKAEKIFNWYAKTKPYVALIKSGHPHSEGYWVEFIEDVNLCHLDVLIKEHKK